MKILKTKNIILFASFLSAVILSFVVISPAIANIKQDVNIHANCVNTIFPKNTERDITINPDTGAILVGYEENGVKKEVTLNLKENLKFSECTDSVKELVTLARKSSDKIDADTCIELNKIISGKQTIPLVDDKKMNMVAVNNYILNHCK